MFLILGGFVCSFSDAPRNHFCSPAQPVATKSAAPVWVRSGGTPPPPAKRIPFVSPTPPGTVLKAGPGSLPPFKRGRAAQDARPRSRSAQPGIAMGKAAGVQAGGFRSPPASLSPTGATAPLPWPLFTETASFGGFGAKKLRSTSFFPTAAAGGGEARFGEKKIY